MKLSLPLLLTLARVVVIPLLVVLFYLPVPYSRQIAALLFAGAAITDVLDGWLARRWNQTSRFGAFLDPVADKLIVAVALVMLLRDRPDGLLAALVALIIGREITVSALREWMAELGQRTSVAVISMAKVKTIFQMVAIVLMLWREPILGLPVYAIGYALLLVAAALTIYSMAIYLRVAWPILTDRDA